MTLIEKCKILLHHAAILTALLMPMLLIAQLYFIIKTKKYSKRNILTAVFYAVLIVIAFFMLNITQRFYLAVFFELISVPVFIIIIIYQIYRKYK